MINSNMTTTPMMSSNMTTNPKNNSNMTTTPMLSSNRLSSSSSQLPLSFPTPPAFNFGQQQKGPVGASHPQRMNTPAPSQRLLDSLLPGLDDESLFGDF